NAVGVPPDAWAGLALGMCDRHHSCSGEQIPPLARSSVSPHQSPPMARQRLPLTLAACVACLLGPVAVASACDNASAPPSRATMADARSATLCLINEARAKRGLGRLGSASALARAAV